MKIFCVEDDKNIRDLIIYAVNNSGMDCLGFVDAKSMFDALQGEIPDLILMDIMLPETDGVMALSLLKKNPDTAEIPVIFVTAKAEEYDRVSGLDAGADDYIVKPFSVLELISRIKAVLRRTTPKDSEKLTVGGITLDQTSHRVFVGDKEVLLTNKEYQLLFFLMENEGVLISRDTLLNRVWGFDFQVETRTVDVHIRYLRQKLGESGNIIETVRGAGYRMVAENEA
jgi:two-component system alkaline phosphatase synthesis response regulator PhoP